MSDRRIPQAKPDRDINRVFVGIMVAFVVMLAILVALLF